jgi:HJR/Mrr/RecB family endonuclease
MSDYENAIKKLEDMVRHRMEAEEIGEAHFIIGKCKEQQGRFADAAADFTKVAESAADKETKASALSHEQYCNSRASWSNLTEVQKFFWWIIGRKPDDTILTRLQIQKKDFLEEQFKTMLQKQDFSIPEPIDFQGLIEAGKKAAAEQLEKGSEQVKAERWARDQVPKIESYLEKGALNKASLACEKVVYCLKDSDGIAFPSVISVLEKCNKYSEKKSQGLNKKLLQLDARQFEFEIANLFRRKGYKSFATRVTRDDGVDVFASNDDEKVIIQCKRWKHPVGRDKVDELAGVQSRHGTARAILATTSTFSEDAKRAAHENGIELWDFHRIKREWQEALMAK